MRTSWIIWTWPLFILLSTLAVALITYLFPEIGVVRPAVIMGFLFIIPGITVVRFFRLNGPAIEWMLAIALSFTIDASVAVIILYAGEWSPKNIMSFLIGFCFTGALAQLLIVHPASHVVELLSSDFEKVTTVTLAKPLSFDCAEVTTINLAKPLPSDFEDTEATIILKTVKVVEDKAAQEAEDTRQQSAVLLQQFFQEDTQEKTVSLDKSELLGKEA